MVDVQRLLLKHWIGDMKEVVQEYKHAVSVGSITLVGIRGKPPFKSGNCFSVALQEGGWCQIVNFNHENLEYLKSQKIIEFPIKVLMLSERHGVFCDSRIPSEFYQDEFCNICTPSNLIPITQRIKQLLDIQQGYRKEYDNGVIEHICRPQKLELKEKWKVEFEEDISVYQGLDPEQELNMDGFGVPGFIWAPYVPVYKNDPSFKKDEDK